MMQVLTSDDKLQLGRITTRDEAGRHFMEAYPGEWLERMEAAGYITITRPVHEPTGISYSQEYYTVEVSPEVAEWFDSFGELYEEGDELPECGFCHRRRPGKNESRDHGEICDNCYEDEFGTCYRCDAVVRPDQLEVAEDGRTICLDCLHKPVAED